MSVVRPSSLSSTDIETILAAYGTDYVSLVNDIQNQTLPEDVTAEDALAFLFEYYQSASFLDPDDSALAYLWEDDTVMGMLDEFRDANQSNTDLTYLVQDIEVFLEAGGYPSDPLNEAARIVEEYADILSGSSSSSDEFENLIVALKKINPGLYLLLYVMYELGPEVEEGIDVINDKNEDALEELEEAMEVVEDADYEDPQAQGEIDAAKYKIQNIQEAVKGYSEISELLFELVEQTLETANNYFTRANRAAQNILSG